MRNTLTHFVDIVKMIQVFRNHHQKNADVRKESHDIAQTLSQPKKDVEQAIRAWHIRYGMAKSQDPKEIATLNSIFLESNDVYLEIIKTKPRALFARIDTEHLLVYLKDIAINGLLQQKEKHQEVFFEFAKTSEYVIQKLKDCLDACYLEAGFIKDAQYMVDVVFENATPEFIHDWWTKQYEQEPIEKEASRWVRTYFFPHYLEYLKMQDVQNGTSNYVLYSEERFWKKHTTVAYLHDGLREPFSKYIDIYKHISPLLLYQWYLDAIVKSVRQHEPYDTYGALIEKATSKLSIEQQHEIKHINVLVRAYLGQLEETVLWADHTIQEKAAWMLGPEARKNPNSIRFELLPDVLNVWHMLDGYKKWDIKTWSDLEACVQMMTSQVPEAGNALTLDL